MKTEDYNKMSSGECVSFKGADHCPYCVDSCIARESNFAVSRLLAKPSKYIVSTDPGDSLYPYEMSAICVMEKVDGTLVVVESISVSQKDFKEVSQAIYKKYGTKE